MCRTWFTFFFHLLDFSLFPSVLTRFAHWIKINTPGKMRKKSGFYDGVHATFIVALQMNERDFENANTLKIKIFHMWFPSFFFLFISKHLFFALLTRFICKISVFLVKWMIKSSQKSTFTNQAPSMLFQPQHIEFHSIEINVSDQTISHLQNRNEEKSQKAWLLSLNMKISF